MHPELDLGPVTLQTFGICFGLAFVACGLVLARLLQEIGRPRAWASEIVFAALLGGLVGARVDYIAQNYDKVSNDLLGNLFSGSGLVWYGGFAGGAIGVALWAWRRNWLRPQLLDLTAPALALGYAIGRVGCQVSGDGDYGTPWDGPWAMAYPHGTVPTDVPVHPTPVYETLSMGLVAVVLWQLRNRFRPGVLFAVYLVLAGVERLLVEFIRRNSNALVGLTLPQLISIVMIAAGGAWLVERRDALAAMSSRA